MIHPAAPCGEQGSQADGSTLPIGAPRAEGSARELLKLAAKAAGLHIVGDADVMVLQPGRHAGGFVYRNERGGDSLWNPLTDDGDALRLAVTLRIVIQHAPRYVVAITPALHPEHEDNGHDPAAATRRAIVRAAAAHTTGQK